MILNAMANQSTRAVNPNMTATLYVSTGYVTGADGTQVPAYANAVTGLQVNVQALSGGDIRHADALNLQGILRTIYVNRRVQGINRPAGLGGDKLEIATGLSKRAVDEWLVCEVVEPWDVSGWTRVIAVLQQ